LVSDRQLSGQHIRADFVTQPAGYKNVITFNQFFNDEVKSKRPSLILAL